MKFKNIGFQNTNGKTLSLRLDLPLVSQEAGQAIFVIFFTCHPHSVSLTAKLTK